METVGQLISNGAFGRKGNASVSLRMQERPLGSQDGVS